MRKVILLTTVFMLVFGLVYAWGIDKAEQGKPMPITANPSFKAVTDKPAMPTMIKSTGSSKTSMLSPSANRNESNATPSKPDHNVILQGGEDISSAVAITPDYSNTGTTSGYANDYNEDCPYTGSTAPDVVYSYTPAVDTFISVDLYGSSYDTKLFIYENSEATLVDCNDDYWDDYTSALFLVPVTAGNVYYIVIDGYDGDSYGDYAISAYQDVPATGRCCDYTSGPSTPVCTADITEANCVVNNLQVWTEALTCSDACEIALDNDFCEFAEAVSGPYPVSGTGTTVGSVNTECPDLLAWDNTVWYAIDMPYSSNDVTIQICGASEDLYNTGIILMNDCDCDDYLLYDSYAWAYCDNGYEGITLTFTGVTAGTWYWPAMEENSSSEGMDFEYTIDVIETPIGRCCDYTDPYNPTCTDGLLPADCAYIWSAGLNCTDNPCPLPPANDECTAAEAIVAPYPATGTGTTFAATDDCTDMFSGWNGTWYEIELPYAYNNITINVCPTSVDVYSIGPYLMDDCACDDYLSYTSYEFYTCDNGYLGYQLYFQSVPQGTGTIMWPNYTVDENYAGIDFEYTVDIAEYVPIQGDMCSDPLIVDAVPFSSSGYSCDFGDFCDVSGYNNSDIIYEWVVSAEYVYAVSLCSSDYDTQLAIYLDECCTGVGTEYAYNDDYCSTQSYIEMVFIPGTYYVVVDGYGTACGNYVLDITAIGEPPTGRCCYGDVYAYECADVSEYTCLTTYNSELWTEGLTCDSIPCESNGHFGITPTSIVVDSIGVGETTTQALTVTNSGNGTLTFTPIISFDIPAVSASIAPVEITKTNQIALPIPKGESSKTPSKPDHNIILQGGDDISTAVAITLPYANTGTTDSYTDDYDEECYSASTSPDVVYSYLATADGYIDIDLYGSSYDTKLFVYENSTANLVGCNDDYYSDWTSALFSVPVTHESVYYIVVDGYYGDYGDYVITVGYSPKGKCCDFADIMNPVCTEDVYAAQCSGTGLMWTEGGNCTDNPCLPMPICAENYLMCQPPMAAWESDWNFYTSDIDGPYAVYENFGGAYSIIEGLTFWGIGLNFYNDIPCTPSSNFQIIFYQDTAGVPGTVVATYDVVPTINSSSLIYSTGYGNCEMYEYAVTFDPAVTLQQGWVSIQNTDSDSCSFLLATSYFGDGDALQLGDDVFSSIGVDVALSLTGNPWLTIDANYGAIDAGGSPFEITATMDATDLDTITYTASIDFATNDPNNAIFSVPVSMRVYMSGYQYVPGDANMINGQWPPQVIGGDVTYMVNYFRGINSACKLGGYYCAADANGDCQVIGSDVTKMVNYFRGITAISHCANYEPLWHSSSECPTVKPTGWPPCE